MGLCSAELRETSQPGAPHLSQGEAPSRGSWIYLFLYLFETEPHCVEPLMAWNKEVYLPASDSGVLGLKANSIITQWDDGKVILLYIFIKYPPLSPLVLVGPDQRKSD